MNQLEIYFLSKNKIPNIVYIGIGSACVRDSQPKNMQQFPPWLESEYVKTNKTFCVINIDPQFESPYLLTQLFPIIEDEKNSSDMFKVFTTDRFECIYINQELEFLKFDNESRRNKINELVIKPFDTINKLVMESQSLLISGLYTGVSNSILENYFLNLYSGNSKYSSYPTNITYNFMNDLYGSCVVNLVENLPLIDYSQNQIIKIENAIKTPHIYKNIIGFERKIAEFSLSKLKNMLNMEIFIYRNYLNRSYGQHMDWINHNSIFKDIDIRYYTEFEKSKSKMCILIYDNYIDYLLALTCIDTKSNEEIIQTIELLRSIPLDPVQIYTWINNFSKSLGCLKQIYLDCTNV